MIVLVTGNTAKVPSFTAFVGTSEERGFVPTDESEARPFHNRGLAKIAGKQLVRKLGVADAEIRTLSDITNT